MKQPPFKVLCIAEGNWDHTNNRPVKSPLKVLNEYTVVSAFYDGNLLVYNLAEIKRIEFYSELFATLPSTTADEMQEAEKEAILM